MDWLVGVALGLAGWGGFGMFVVVVWWACELLCVVGWGLCVAGWSGWFCAGNKKEHRCLVLGFGFNQ